MIFTFRLRWR